jgi:FAD/FMN-containing dehydrogenase
MAVGAAACGGPGSKQGSGATSTLRTTTTTAHSTGPPDWRVLAGSLTGTLVQPGNSGYAAGAQLYNELYSPQPAAIAYCATPSDVQRCVAFARDHQVSLAARSGGHSYGGYSSCPGLVIDVSPLHGVVVGATAGTATPTATIGAGATLLDVYSQLGNEGLLLPGGSCPTVGIAGLALGGGIGVFGRAYGLTCDQIESVQMVTADATLRQCGPNHYEDLYWASRGGGGGNFGVVTSFGFRLHAIPPVTLFTLEWPWGAAGTALDAWLTWLPSTPNELWSNCQLLADGTTGSGRLKVTGVYAGSTTDCQGALAPLHTMVGQATTDSFVGPETYLNAMLIEAGCEGDSVAQCSAAPTRSPFTAKSSFVDSALPTNVVNGLVSAVESLASEVPGVGGGIVFDGFGGVVNQVGPAETAFVHRESIACAQYSITFATAPPVQSVAQAASAWLSQIAGLFAPVTHGSYQNYIDPSLTDWAHAYYGSNLPRLGQIKQRYDPDDLFRFAQSIPLPT